MLQQPQHIKYSQQSSQPVPPSQPLPLPLPLPQPESNVQDSSLYDTYCKDIYGDRTCLLVGNMLKNNKDNEHIYEVRMLDQPTQKSTITSKKYFHTLIPNLLRYKYTVIIIEEINKNYEIMAIHLPGHLFEFLK